MKEHIFAKRVENLGTEKAFEVMNICQKLEAQGKDIVYMQIGEPDFDTPKNIVDAAIDALKQGYTHYSPNTGVKELKSAIVNYVQRYKGFTCQEEEVVVVPGGKPVMFFAMLALIEEQDEVLYPNPGYPIYESLIHFTGAKAVPMPILEENQFELDIEDLKTKINDKTKMIILNSPGNPTGGVLSRENLMEIVNLVKDRDIYILSDEIYSRIIYGEEFTSIASLPGMKERTIILDGFSKTYAMTGWRMGFGIMPEAIAQKVEKLISNSTSNTSTFTQIAGIEALNGPQDRVLEMVEIFRKRRDLIVEGLNNIDGIHCEYPKGAFYVFPNIKDLGMPSEEFADYLLEEGVAVLDGFSFGAYGEGHIRLSYATSEENILEGLKRIDAAVRKLKTR